VAQQQLASSAQTTDNPQSVAPLPSQPGDPPPPATPVVTDGVPPLSGDAPEPTLQTASDPRLLDLPDSRRDPLIRSSDPDTETLLRHAITLMDGLAGVRAAMAMLAAKGRLPGVGVAPPRRPDSAPRDDDPSPVPASESPPLTGSAPAGSAGAAGGGGGGSAALYALVIALAALAGGLCGRLQLVPVRWRSVTLVALNERPG
jgi:hypothetical protein